MKTKIIGMLILALFLLSVISVVADVEMPEETPLTEAQKEEKCITLGSEGKQGSDEAQELKCFFKPKEKKSGNSGFYIAKGKTLFGMKSNYDGRGFGLSVGQFFPKQIKKMPLNVHGNILQIRIASWNKQVGFNKNQKAVHFKEVDAKNNIFTYEILSNLDKDTKYLLKIKVLGKNPIMATLDGQLVQVTKLKVKSNMFSYYTLELHGVGLLEVKKAQ